MMKRLFALLLLTLTSFAQAPLPTRLKTPAERFDFSYDFTPSVGTDAITIVAVTAKNVSTLLDSTLLLIAASPAPQVIGQTVLFRVQGGLDKETHLVSVKVQDSVTGSITEGLLQIRISSSTN